MRQHYLPVFYLNHFTDPSTPAGQHPYVWVFKGEKWKNKSPENTANSPNFYSFKEADGTINHSFEKFWNKLESNFAPVLARISAKPPTAMSDQERQSLSLLMVTMIQRVPGYIEGVAEGIAEVYRQVHWLKYQQLKEDPKQFEKVKERLQKDLQVDYGKMTIEDWHPEKYTVNVPNAYVLATSIKTMPKLASFLSQLNWTMLVTKVPSFITCDYPVVSKTPGAKGNVFDGAWADPETEITFPLTSKIGLLCSRKGKESFSLAEPSLEQLRTMNLRTVSASSGLELIAATVDFPGSDVLNAV